MAHINDPSLWRSSFPFLSPDTHKYKRGHAIVVGGGVAATGAARLAALSALRIGAGLVTIACPPSALSVYAAALTAVMVKPVRTEEALLSFCQEGAKDAFLIGPGAGVNDATLREVVSLLTLQKPLVLDADALTVFAGQPHAFRSSSAPLVLTPHAGEFERLFVYDAADRTGSALRAAEQSSAIVVLKGAETVIAHPDGRAVLNRHASPHLATAGSGDVLAGMITGLLASGVEPFYAACIAVWLHGDAAIRFGAGLIAEDLPELLPRTLQSLLGKQ